MSKVFRFLWFLVVAFFELDPVYPITHGSSR